MDLITYTDQGLPVIPLNKFLSTTANPPILEDLRKLADVIGWLCENVGCFCLADLDVDWSLLDACFEDSRRFFTLPQEEKLRYWSKQHCGMSRGYKPYETLNMNAFMGKKGFPGEATETLYFGTSDCDLAEEQTDYEKTQKGDPFLLPNIYPRYPDTFKRNIQQVHREFAKVGQLLKPIFSLAMGVQDPLFLTKRSAKQLNYLRINYYPENSVQKLNQDRFAAHLDVTPFTLLYATPVKNSLMVKDHKGKWFYANPPPKTIFVNIGKCIAYLTNGHWPATLHKVVFPADGQPCHERQSFIYVVGLDPDLKIQGLPHLGTNNGKASNPEMLYRDFMLSRRDCFENGVFYEKSNIEKPSMQ